MIFGEMKIEDLKMPLKIISTNINTGEKHIFEKGYIVDAIRSSISIPGMIMPYKMGDEELVDGGIVNNLPIEVLSCKNIVAVSVIRDITRPIEPKFKMLGFELKHNIF
jgi:NTE family protein